MAVNAVSDCEDIVFGGNMRFLDRWKRLTRLVDARQRIGALVNRGSSAVKLIGIACVAQADTIAATELGKLPDHKISAILASNNDELIYVLHLSAQHVDRKPGFQVRLAKLFGAPNCERNSETVRGRCAYLADRVLLAFGRPHMYGTQYDCALMDLPDVLEIELRRRKVGIVALNDYQKSSQ